jgi:hypothetical protein
MGVTSRTQTAVRIIRDLKNLEVRSAAQGWGYAGLRVPHGVTHTDPRRRGTLGQLRFVSAGPCAYKALSPEQEKRGKVTCDGQRHRRDP